MTVTLRSFAKINFGLTIGARRQDGFHELLTVYQTIGWHDVIGVSVSRGRGIEIQCSDPKVPKDESNTCYRIIERALPALKAKGRVTIQIDKRLPVQGGLGGASSNAVASLLGLERALKKALPAPERLRIASEVGSDLPLFLVGGTVLGVGRGEQVYPLEDLPSMACVVVTPGAGVSTPKAFAEWDRFMASDVERASKSAGLRSAGQPGAAVLTPAWTGKSARPHTSGSHTSNPHTSNSRASRAELTEAAPSDRMGLLSRGLSLWLSESYSGAPRLRGRRENPLLGLVRAGIKNDFEKVVFPAYPELSEGKCALERAGAKYASLSGSGSALYGLFASREAARRAVESLRRQGWVAQATATLTRAQYWR